MSACACRSSMVAVTGSRSGLTNIMVVARGFVLVIREKNWYLTSTSPQGRLYSGLGAKSGAFFLP